MDNTIRQRENEHGRLVVPGRRTDNGEHCTLVVVHDQDGRAWSFYPHGAAPLGVRLVQAHAVQLAATITSVTR